MERSYLTEWKLQSSSSSQQPQKHSDLYRWSNLGYELKRYVKNNPDLSDVDYESDCFGNGYWIRLYRKNIGDDDDDIGIHFNKKTSDYRIEANYPGFHTITGTGFNNMLDDLDNIAFTLLFDFDFSVLKESLVEWVQRSVTANTQSATATNNATKSYETYFNKILAYHKKYSKGNVVLAQARDNVFMMTELVIDTKTGNEVEFTVAGAIDPASGKWLVCVYEGQAKTLTDNINGSGGYNQMLAELQLSGILTLPSASHTAYKLLQESVVKSVIDETIQYKNLWE